MIRVYFYMFLTKYFQVIPSKAIKIVENCTSERLRGVTCVFLSSPA